MERQRAQRVLHYRYVLTINAVSGRRAQACVINTPTPTDYPLVFIHVVGSLPIPVSPNTYLM